MGPNIWHFEYWYLNKFWRENFIESFCSELPSILLIISLLISCTFAVQDSQKWTRQCKKAKRTINSTQKQLKLSYLGGNLLKAITLYKIPLICRMHQRSKIWTVILQLYHSASFLTCSSLDPTEGSVSFLVWTVPCVTKHCRHSSFTRLQVPLGMNDVLYIFALQSTEYCSVEVQAGCPQDGILIIQKKLLEKQGKLVEKIYIKTLISSFCMKARSKSLRVKESSLYQEARKYPYHQS